MSAAGSQAALSRQASQASMKESGSVAPAADAAPPAAAPEPAAPGTPKEVISPKASVTSAAQKPPSRQGSHQSLVSGLRQGSHASLRSVAARNSAAAAEGAAPADPQSVASATSVPAAGSRKGSVRSNAAADPAAPSSPLGQSVGEVKSLAGTQTIVSPLGEPAAEPGTPAGAPDASASLADAVNAEIGDADESPPAGDAEIDAAPEVGVVVSPPEADPSAELAEAQKKVYSLEQTVASLQRLMAQGSSDTKIKMLTQDLADRSQRIKKLEAELKAEKQRADEAEKKLKDAPKKGMKRLASFRTTGSTSEGDAAQQAIVKQQHEEIQRLKRKLSQMKVQASAADGVQAPVQSRASSVCEQEKTLDYSFMQETSRSGGVDREVLSDMQRRLTESEAEKAVLRAKLAKAQDAIVSAAGSGFENEVKLQQARSALKSILGSSQSPQNARQRSVSASVSPAQRSASPAYSTGVPAVAPAASPPVYSAAAAYASPPGYRHVSPYRYSTSPARY